MASGEGVGYINIPFVALLVQGIPETVAIVTLAFVIAKIPFVWNKILLIGILLALCVYMIRQFPIPFGIHIFFQIILLFILLTSLGKGDFSLSLLASLLSFLVLTILEFTCLSLLMIVFGVTPEILFANLEIRIVIGEPTVLILFLTAYLLNKLMQKERPME